ncbi:MAG: hypothetical protein IT220_04965 [Flavobacteriaceae bacterium]|nr:hypothetical protein [Flavobacteriaceae bacterium]
MGTTKNLISFQYLKEGIEVYQNSFDTKTADNQTKAVWFSLADLKEFMAYVESEAKAKNITVSGIRFHFIAENNTPEAINLALCPTYEGADGKGEIQQISFDPKQSETGKPADLSSLLNNTSKAATISSVMNNGNRCPQFC